MREGVFVLGVLVMAGALTYAQLRYSRRRFDTDLEAFAATVRAPLTDEVERWLRPQLRRRTLYPTLGGLWGLLAGNFWASPQGHEIPWYWFAVVVGTAVGTTGGHLLAAYRTAPLVDGPTRTADPVRRRVSQHFDRAHVLRLRLAVVVSLLALAVSVLTSSSGDTSWTRRGLVASGLGVLLVVAHHWVTARALSRPMVSSTPEGLVWRKAVLATTVDRMPTDAFVVAVASAAIAVHATFATTSTAPLVALWSAAGLTLLVVAATAHVVVTEGRAHGWWRSDAPADSATP